MNRRLILVFTIVLILATATIIFFYFFGDKPTIPAKPSSGLGSTLPSGAIGGSNGFGQGGTSVIIGGGSDTQSGVLDLPRLRHLTLVPTAGSIILSKQINVLENRVKVLRDSYSVRYMDRATGHIFEIKTNEPEATDVTNTTIPKIYEATFTPSGNTVIARFLSPNNDDLVLTYSVLLRDKKVTATSSKPTVAEIKDANEPTLKETVGTYLTAGIDQIALSPSADKLLSLSRNGNSGTFIVTDASGKNPRTVLTHPLRQWLLSFPTERTAVVATKPSAITNGYAYTLNIATGELRKIIGGMLGLTILPNQALDTHLVARALENSIELFSYKGSEGTPKTLPLRTLPEKCVWAHKNASIVYCAVPVSIVPALYPDDWYKGRVAFTDQIWSINITTGETKIISDLPKESGQAIDGTNLMLSLDDTYLTFINKTDLTLWGLDLGEKK